MKRIILALCLTTTTAALAQDAGLYDDIASPDASFVRVIVPPNGVAMVQTTSFDALDTGLSPYVVVDQPGEVQISAGVDETTATVEAGKFYTYIVGEGGAGELMTDKITRSPGQADVAFYNLSDVPTVDLYVPAAKAVAIPGVAAGKGDAVALKAPLSIDFELRDGDKVLATVAAVDLKRREGVTIVLRGTGGTYTAFSAANALAR
jgi:Alginate O-acetyl transferase AlgF